MDKNLAALLRADAKTLTVRFMADFENGTRKSKPYTYVSHLPLAKGDGVVVDASGRTVVAVVETIDDEVKIEPGCDTEYKWVIGKIDMAAHEANEKRNAEIVAEAAVIVRENMRKSFASQVLGAASPRATRQAAAADGQHGGLIMARIKVAEAADGALDWMVAKALNPADPQHGWDAVKGKPVWTPYSTDWSQGGPIIERERITIRYWTNMALIYAFMPHDDDEWEEGLTPLIAAMRCFVASKLGDEVDVPDELV